MDFRGWDSSYTDDPIPLEEMVEWRAATVDRILALQPRRVLEIGVGSGLVLSQIAPHCEHYVGTDISPVAIDTLARSLEQLQIAWRDRVQLLTQPAHVTGALPQGYFDTIILNSVIQYFPNAGYLAEVIDNAMDLLAPGGAVFIGDVRNHSLQRALQTGVALARATATSDAAEIRQRVQRAMLGETELLLAPEFFTTWAADRPSVAGLDIEVKRGVADNELNRYRYDVTIHKAPAPLRSLAAAASWAWAQCAGLRGLHERLMSQRPDAVRVTEIPRAGLISDVRIEHALADGLPLADALAQADAADAVVPEELHRLGEATGYHVAVTWGAQPGTLDAVFIAPSTPTAAHPSADRPLPAPDGARQRSTHANDPHTNTKISAVRQRLSAWLPEYMVPTHIVVLDEFPLTSSGKLDRRRCPHRSICRPQPSGRRRTQTEENRRRCVRRGAGVDKVGVDDSFFDLGGDSMSAMRLIAAVNCQPGCRSFGARRVRGAHGCPVGAPYRWGGESASARWWRVSGPRWFRCRLPRAGCGSSTSCRGLHRFTTWRWRCGCAVRLMPRRWVRRWPMWWAGMRACARCCRRSRGYRGSWCCPPSGPISAGRSSMPPAGRKAGWVRPSARRRVTRLTWQPRSLAGKAFPRR